MPSCVIPIDVTIGLRDPTQAWDGVREMLKINPIDVLARTVDRFFPKRIAHSKSKMVKEVMI